MAITDRRSNYNICILYSAYLMGILQERYVCVSCSSPPQCVHAHTHTPPLSDCVVIHFSLMVFFQRFDLLTDIHGER